jgi:hypothetical protein
MIEKAVLTAAPSATFSKLQYFIIRTSSYMVYRSILVCFRSSIVHHHSAFATVLIVVFAVAFSVAAP